MFNLPVEITIKTYKLSILNTSLKTFIQPIYLLIQQVFTESIIFLQVFFH